MSAEEYKKTFCNNVHCLREKEGLSIVDLAKRSGISQEMLKQLEQNILPEEMMVDDAFALARAFGCKVHELFE